MARPIDYSKWKDIDTSDEDDDDMSTSSNDPKHQSEAFAAKKFDQQAKQRQLDDLKTRAMLAVATEGDFEDPDLDSLLDSMADLEVENERMQKELEDLVKKEEEERPVRNADATCKDGFNRTLFSAPPTPKKEMTEEEREQHTQDFVKAHEREMQQFGWLWRIEDSKAFLEDKKHLVCQETADYLNMQCIKLAVKEKFDALERVANQCVGIQYLLKLAEQLGKDPRDCISSCFAQIEQAGPEYKMAFAADLEAFKERIHRRVKEENMEELKQVRLEPEGLDPVEVFETLPQVLKECIVLPDTEKLNRALREMSEEEARNHLTRCVESGLIRIEDLALGEKEG